MILLIITDEKNNTLDVTTDINKTIYAAINESFVKSKKAFEMFTVADIRKNVSKCGVSIQDVVRFKCLHALENEIDTIIWVDKNDIENMNSSEILYLKYFLVSIDAKIMNCCNLDSSNMYEFLKSEMKFFCASDFVVDIIKKLSTISNKTEKSITTSSKKSDKNKLSELRNIIHNNGTFLFLNPINKSTVCYQFSGVLSETPISYSEFSSTILSSISSDNVELYKKILDGNVVFVRKNTVAAEVIELLLGHM